MRRNLSANGIGVNKILETPSEIGLELTQYKYGNLDTIEEIITTASIDAGVEKPIKKELRIADLNSYTEFGDDFREDAEIIYERSKRSGFSSNNIITFRPFLASREEFFKGSILVENNSEYIFLDNFFFSSNIFVIFD